MSEKNSVNPFAKVNEPLAMECDRCTRQRELAAQAQRLMDQVHNGRRVFVIPPVKCTHCDEGFKLTQAGAGLAVLFANYIAALQATTAAEEATSKLPL